MASAGYLRYKGFCITHEIPGSILLPGITYINKMMWNEPPHPLIRLSRPDIKQTIDLDRIRADDLPLKGSCQADREGGFPYRRRTGQHNQRFFCHKIPFTQYA